MLLAISGLKPSGRDRSGLSVATARSQGLRGLGAIAERRTAVPLPPAGCPFLAFATDTGCRGGS
eukprot:5688428-Alexandrium_andersonii.AAC.1